MKIVSIEPTPSPNSMKINMSESLPEGETHNYKEGDDHSSSPDFVQQLFSIEGVKGLYHVLDFIALERNARVPWESILPEVRNVFGEEKEEQVASASEPEEEDSFGEVKVFIQMFKGIPMQVKLEDRGEEKRVGLEPRFQEAAMEAAPASPNMIMERQWVEQSPRYGDADEVGEQVKEEISASYDEERLKSLVKQAFDQNSNTEESSQKKADITLETLDHDDWKVRYAALDRMDPTADDYRILDKALDDEKASIRRLATAYLGMIEEMETLPFLYKALQDKSVTVRRTAGDCISDLGFKEAMPKMIESLKDPNRLVRWRSAMFLYELGDESALPALKEAADDPEFEVRMQINMAIERIEGGEEAKGSVWHQMTQATKQKNK